MRIFTRLFLLLAAISLTGALSAQQCDKTAAATHTRKVVITKINQDGTTSKIERDIPEGENWRSVVEDIDWDDIRQVDVDIRSEVHEQVKADTREHTLVYIRTAREAAEAAKESMKSLHVRWVEGEKRPILGIYPGSTTEQGLQISSLVDGGGAQLGGLQDGDILVSVDGQPTVDGGALRGVLSKHAVGDQVPVVFLRNGQQQTTMVTLGESTDSYAYGVERDPCKVFIGVTVGGTGSEGRGVEVNQIIDDTPAQEYGVQDGDVILALDDVTVNSYSELLRERNKHQPGDFFTLSVLRNGQPMDIDARFKSCATETETEVEEEVEVEEATIVVEEEVVEPVVPVEPVVTPDPLVVDSSLPMQSFTAYPNPTYGRLNLQFQTAAQPTQISVLDINGRAVYERSLNRFDGYFNQEIDLGRAAPGTYILRVQQGDLVKSEKIVVLPRA